MWRSYNDTLDLIVALTFYLKAFAFPHCSFCRLHSFTFSCRAWYSAKYANLNRPITAHFATCFANYPFAVSHFADYP